MRKSQSWNESPILLDKRLLAPLCKKNAIVLEIFDTLASTNDYLKTIENKDKKNRICLAEQQMQGKGQFQRAWHSPFGENLYFSLRYRFEKNLRDLAGLSLVIGLAVIKTLQNYIDFEELSLKWPNDIMYADKKLAGILIEIQAEALEACYAVIGIGMNVNMLNDEEKMIKQPWISLRQITQRYFNRNEITLLLIENILYYLQKFNVQRLSAFETEWKKVDYLWGKSIDLHHGTQMISAVAQGINSQGHLLVKLSDGSIKAFSSGEVTLLKREK